jgi:mono/diheme cytochrome c family protein
MARHGFRFVLGVIFCCRSLTFAAGSPDADLFEMKVRPILARNCYTCHSKTALGGLRLDSPEGVMKGGNSGKAISPGKPDESLLIQAVRQTDAHLKMPPTGKLKDEEIAVLTEWVSKGAVWPEVPASSFEAKVRPILLKNCYSCHTSSRLGGLRLDSRETTMKGGNDGPVIVPGKPDESLLIQAVRRTHERFKMPPTRKLSDEEIAI